MNKKDFFQWCKERNLNTDNEISSFFNVTNQTLKNWKKYDDNKKMRHWIAIVCEGHDLIIKKGCNLNREEMTIAKFNLWRDKNSIETYNESGLIFDIKRQAIHNWFKRGKIPKWLSLTCNAFDIIKENKKLD